MFGHVKLLHWEELLIVADGGERVAQLFIRLAASPIRFAGLGLGQAFARGQRVGKGRIAVTDAFGILYIVKHRLEALIPGARRDGQVLGSKRRLIRWDFQVEFGCTMLLLYRISFWP